MKNYMVDIECQELAKKILEKIEADPRNHNQSIWGGSNSPDLEACGTVACAAGWAAILTGNATVVENKSWRENLSESNETRYVLRMIPEALELIPDAHRHPHELEDFEYLGQHLLGLSEMERSILFFNTTNNEAKEALEYIARGLPIDWLRVLSPPMIDDLRQIHGFTFFTYYPKTEISNG